MGDKRIFEKLEKVNSEKEEIVFEMKYKGKVIHQKNIELLGYAHDIVEDEELSFFYFFKDMANKLEDKINEVHKKKVWQELNKRETNGENGSTDKTTRP